MCFGKNIIVIWNTPIYDQDKSQCFFLKQKQTFLIEVEDKIIFKDCILSPPLIAFVLYETKTVHQSAHVEL